MKVWNWVPVNACGPLKHGWYVVLLNNTRKRVVKYDHGKFGFWSSKTKPTHVYCCRGVAVKVEEPDGTD